MNSQVNVPGQSSAPGSGKKGALISLIQLMRPLHWIKNLFVLAGIFFAEFWVHPEPIPQAVIAFFAFCLAASAVYCVNDALDVKEDREHPDKRNRPLASGAISLPAGYALACGLAAGSLSLSMAINTKLSLALIAYMVVNALYSRVLKNIVLVDVFCIAFGFIIRLLAGTWGIGVPPSQWFLLCTMALSLFLGFSKRYAERVDPLRPLEKKRKVVQHYSPEFLRILLSVTLSATLITYGLYTTHADTLAYHQNAKLLYSLPLAMFGLFRYLYLVMEKGKGENIVMDVLKDKTLLIVCMIYPLWVYTLFNINL